jgi:hypothetical protein
MLASVGELVPVLFFGFFIAFAIFIVRMATAGIRRFDQLSVRGLPARGILLQVAPNAARQRSGFRRFESRWVHVDVELPGQPPYEIAATVTYPANLSRDILPGVTVELRVDPGNPRAVAIVGPGVGFAFQALVQQAPGA